MLQMRYKLPLSASLPVAFLAPFLAFMLVTVSACTPTDVGLAAFPKHLRPVAACIIKRESGGNAGAISATHDYGLFQINRLAHKRTFERMYGGPFERKALDARLNGQYAYYLYLVAGWSPWRGGKYRCF